MNFRFRDEVSNAKSAAMGEMFNLAKDNMQPGDRLINFASGHPSTDVFHDEIIKKYINVSMEKVGKDIFQYGSHAGYMPLRKALIEFINQRGNIVKADDDLIITYGATEAIFLTAQALVNSRDKVIVEVPTYVNAIKSFQLSSAELIGVSMEEDGVNLEELENAMKMGAKFYYTVPNFGNPSGITMSSKKRKAVYDLSVKYQVPILEDNTYGELRYRNKRLSNIKEFDEEGAVIYVGSMSKMIVPAMRIGFMAANQEIIKRIIKVKAVSSNGVTNIMQHVLWRMFSENDMYEQIQRVCDINAKKLLLTEECMERYFPVTVKRSSPDGGMFIWVTLPDGADVEKFCIESAVRLHIPITPGNGFCVTEPEKCTSMRLNFVKESMEDIEYGMEKIGGLMECYRY